MRVINVDGVRGSTLRAAIQSIYAREVSAFLEATCLTRICSHCCCSHLDPSQGQNCWTQPAAMTLPAA